MNGTHYGVFCAQCGFAHNMPSSQEHHVTEKPCRTCGVVKELAAFPRSNGSHDGHKHTCSTCAAQQKDEQRTQQQAAKEQHDKENALLRSHGYRWKKVVRRALDYEGWEEEWEEWALFHRDGHEVARAEALQAIAGLPAEASSETPTPEPAVLVFPLVLPPTILPPLKGTERQISWADDIRRRQLTHVRNALTALAEQVGALPDLRLRLAQLPHMDSAGWWIQHRDDAPDVLLKHVKRGSAAHDVNRPYVHTRGEAVVLARQLLDGPTLFLDTETTGLDADAALVDIALIRESGAVALDLLINPERPIPDDATAIHNITNAMVADEPVFATLWPMIWAHLQEVRYIAVYNASFDMPLIRRHASALHTRDKTMPIWSYRQADDVLRLYLAYCGSSNHIGLRDACAALGIKNQIAHRALSDARATLELVRHIASGVAPSLHLRGEALPDQSIDESSGEEFP